MLKHKKIQYDGQVDTLIGPQVVIQGDFHFSGGLYVEGRITGRLIAEDGQKAALTLADNGSIEGEVRVPVAVINGRVTGDIFSSERIQLGARARVEGNVHYKVVEMVAGSVLTGRLVHVESAEAAGVDDRSQPPAEGAVRLTAVGG